MPRPKRGEPTTIDLDLTGTVNGVAFRAAGMVRVVGQDVPLHVELARATEVLHWDPLLVALACCEAAGFAADLGTRAIAREGELAVESRAVVHDDQGRRIGDVATSAIVDGPEAACAPASRSLPPTCALRRRNV